MAAPNAPKRFRAPRGVADLLPEEQPIWRFVRETAVRVAESYGYGEIQTPVFEHAGVFLRPGSEGTDVVDKEVYRFDDRGGDALVLRPEGTAAVCRAFLEHGMGSRPQPVRLFYLIDSFRYDRPQAGRSRVFHQFGVEAIGDGDPAIDAEVIDLQCRFYEALGLGDLTILLNSIGDPVCRPAYLEELRAYYADKRDQICGDCRRRYEINPLRLLDCKNEPCQPFKPEAPKIADHLCGACANHFSAVRRYLDDLDIAYQIEPTLVRGLDYYSRTTFEFQPREEGSQSTIGAGGRYDGLIEQLGGPATPGIGFGSGLERIILNLGRQERGPPPPAGPDVYLAVADPEAGGRALTLARDLRAAGLSVVAGHGGRSLRSQMRQADALAGRYAVVLGREELAAGTLTLRDLRDAHQETLPLPEALQRLTATV